MARGPGAPRGLRFLLALGAAGVQTGPLAAQSPGSMGIALPWIISGILALVLFLAVSTVLFLFFLRRGLTRKTRALEEVLEDLEETQSCAHIGSWAWDCGKSVFRWSPEMYRIFAVDPVFDASLLVSVTLARIHPDDRDFVAKAWDVLVRTGNGSSLEYRIVLPDGELRHVWSGTGKVLRDSEGKPVTIRGYSMDITEVKEHADRNKVYQEERENLLRELYHRTKNNMFQITALLTLMGDSSDNPEIKAAFQDMVDRIISMSLVHQYLYRSRDFSKVEVSLLLPEIVRYFLREQLPQGKGIFRVHEEVDTVRLPVDVAIALCISITEYLLDLVRSLESREGERVIKLTLHAEAGRIRCILDPARGSAPGALQSQSVFLLDLLVKEQLMGTWNLAEGGSMHIDIPQHRSPL